MTGLPVPLQVPAEDPAIALWARISEEERICLSPHLIGPPVGVGAIANTLGLEVMADALPVDISGQIRLRNADGIYEVKINIADAEVRQRFTVAHEIGHYLLHRDDIDGDGITDTVLFRSNLSDRKEAEANKFAAFILLPWDAVTQWCVDQHGQPPGPTLMKTIASTWKVSELTVGYRFGF